MINDSKSVLILTGDPTIREQMSDLMLKRDYSVLIEKSTIKLISSILEKEIFLIILDLDMINWSNLELIKIIKKVRPRIPIIVLTDDNSVKNLRKLIQIGVFYCAFKPIQVDELEEVIESLHGVKHTFNFMNSCAVAK